MLCVVRCMTVAASNLGRRWHAGVPLNIICSTQLPAHELQAALASIRLASVTLHDSVTRLPPAAQITLLSAMMGSAPTLTAIHGLPLGHLQDGEATALTAFTRLRALSLCQQLRSDSSLRARQLPASVEELTVAIGTDYHAHMEHGTAGPPFTLVGFHELVSLRRISFCNRFHWNINFSDDGRTGRLLHLPPNLEVLFCQSCADALLESTSHVCEVCMPADLLFCQNCPLYHPTSRRC